VCGGEDMLLLKQSTTTTKEEEEAGLKETISSIKVEIRERIIR